MTSEDEKLIVLIRRIFEKTKAGELRWQPTSDPNVFALSFPHYSVSLERVPDTEDTIESFIFRISNDEGQTIEELNSFLASNYGFGELRELFDRVRRNAMGLDKALDDLLSELDEPPVRKS
jgi:hypothetical protein